MKIVCLFGSPRKESNSTKLASRFCDLAKNKNAEIVTYKLNDLVYKGCQGCYVCKTTKDKCILKDDLAKILDDVAECDTLILSSPVYYGDVSAQMKGFIDRTFGYLVPDYPTNPKPSRLNNGKNLVMILTQGHPDENNFSDVFPKYESFFKWLGFTKSYLVRTCGIGIKNDIFKRDDAVSTVENIIKELF